MKFSLGARADPQNRYTGRHNLSAGLNLSLDGVHDTGPVYCRNTFQASCV